MHLWDLSPEVAQCVLRFAQPSTADSVLAHVPESAHTAMRAFLAQLREHGILVDSSAPAEVPRTAEFELTRHVNVFRDIDAVRPGFSELYASIAEDTFTSPPLAYAMVGAMEHIERNDIAGAIVECGVWRGGTMLLVARTLTDPRDLWLYDTFEARWEPRSPQDGYLFMREQPARDAEPENAAESVTADTAEDVVLGKLLATGYPEKRITMVKGLVQDTIPGRMPESIAVLRLDTDFYDSTRHELVHLYPRLSSGGVLIIDDYGKHSGATAATDDYLRGLPNPPLLVRVDVQGRVAVKP
ncbi:hypothetical protein GCM10017774_13290 [Lentzea cavernae]|uniref:Macrocin O-methyltransferase n=2 Tax=Lentzea cavernae TaxID=2020703 RepID=A0ABQ3M562_9PSEU|nr:hypothetical protein GCM10017774_13290 [Lentzea cavernae]